MPTVFNSQQRLSHGGNNGRHANAAPTHQSSYNPPAHGSSSKKPREATALAECTKHELEYIQEAFDLFDNDKDGYIDHHELKVSMRALGFEDQNQEVQTILKTHGINRGMNELQLSFESFQAIMAQRIRDRDPQEEIDRAFDLFDKDKDGYIKLRDLERVSNELGMEIQPKELQSMIDEFDMDGNGVITRDEFTTIMLD